MWWRGGLPDGWLLGMINDCDASVRLEVAQRLSRRS